MSRTIYILVLIAVLAGTAGAQRLVNVPPTVINGLYTTIKNDSVARMAALPTQTIYVLERNGVYPVVNAIENTNYFLYIKAAPGTGYKPLLVPSPTSGTNYAYNFNFRANGKLEGLTLEASQPTGGVRNRYINTYNGASLWVKDCEIMHDRGGAICLQSDSCSVYMQDCFVHSIGHPKILGGNGRVIDVRNVLTADSILVQNTTFFNLSDRIVRVVGAKVNYIKFDHNTGFTTEGFHGGLQAGKTRELIVTNNIFYNPIALGAHKNRVFPGTASEQYQPENTNMYVITLDTMYSDSKVTVKNNNIWWDQAYKDLWVKYKDTTKAPGTVTQTIMKAMGVDSTKTWFTEPLTFQALPPSIYNFVDSALQFPNALVLPENWSFAYQDSTGTKPVNGSYGTTAASYTKADGGFPLGDLNWYPAKKALWLQTNAVQGSVGTIPDNFTLSQNYPNPFNPATQITFSLPKETKVRLEVFDMLGRSVSVLVDDVRTAGDHAVVFDAAGLSTGVYLYRLSSPTTTIARKMLLTK